MKIMKMSWKFDLCVYMMIFILGSHCTSFWFIVLFRVFWTILNDLYFNYTTQSIKREANTAQRSILLGIHAWQRSIPFYVLQLIPIPEGESMGPHKELCFLFMRTFLFLIFLLYKSVSKRFPCQTGYWYFPFVF